MKLAPIALFVYNRAWHTKKTIEALKKNTLAKDSDLVIFSDGPKESQNSKTSVSALREYLKSINGFRNVKIVERSNNYGLGKSIIAGVTEIVKEYGRIIVLEDDIITSRYFLEYLNNGLNLYESDDDVISIHGYIYPVNGILPETYFLKGADCQGWATWKRGWDLFEEDGKKLLEELYSKKLTKEFDFSGSYPYTRMLKDQILGKNSSWAVRWYASAFLKNKFTLYPRESLIYNTGFDGSGTNCGYDDNFNKTQEIEDVKINVERIEILENVIARSAIVDFFNNYNNLFAKGSVLLKRVLKKIAFNQNYFPRFFSIFLNPFYFARLGLYRNIKELSHFISGRVLDVGCGRKPYKSLFSFDEYIGIDIKQSGHLHLNEDVDVFYNGKKFPFDDNYFDSVISNQVLEHTFNPNEHLSEIYRVLKINGHFLVSVPFIWDEHEQPYDYARYSSFGLRHLLEINGFEIIEQRKSISDIRVIFQMINVYIYKKTLWCRKGILNQLITVLLNAPFNIIGIIFFLILPKNKDLYLDNIIVAVKK